MDTPMPPASDELNPEQLRTEVAELRTVVRQLKIWVWLALSLAASAVLAAGLLSGLGAYRLFRPTALEQHSTIQPAQSFTFERMEMGMIPVELVNQSFTTGLVEFSKPFTRRPLVFLCEAGHMGSFLVCKTDALSESNFTWAAGGIPVRRHYASEIAWIAIEPKE
jgi:hypothetical protein